MQRAFVLRMLRSTNFNNLLSAARECHRMLARGVELLGMDSPALRVREGRCSWPGRREEGGGRCWSWTAPRCG